MTGTVLFKHTLRNNSAIVFHTQSGIRWSKTRVKKLNWGKSEIVPEGDGQSHTRWDFIPGGLIPRGPARKQSGPHCKPEASRLQLQALRAAHAPPARSGLWGGLVECTVWEAAWRPSHQHVLMRPRKRRGPPLGDTFGNRHYMCQGVT